MLWDQHCNWHLFFNFVNLNKIFERNAFIIIAVFCFLLFITIALNSFFIFLFSWSWVWVYSKEILSVRFPILLAIGLCWRNEKMHFHAWYRISACRKFLICSLSSFELWEYSILNLKTTLRKWTKISSYTRKAKFSY